MLDGVPDRVAHLLLAAVVPGAQPHQRHRLPRAGQQSHTLRRSVQIADPPDSGPALLELLAMSAV